MATDIAVLIGQIRKDAKYRIEHGYDDRIGLSPTDALALADELDALRAALVEFANPENWLQTFEWISVDDPLDIAKKALEREEAA